VFYPRDDIARGDTATPDSNIGRFSLEEAMFLCQPLLEVLAGRGIENIDAFLERSSTSIFDSGNGAYDADFLNARFFVTLPTGIR
jgi:hypothetical protein